MKMLGLGMGLLLATTAYGQTVTAPRAQGTVAMQYRTTDDVGFRSQMKADLGDYVATHLYNKQVGKPWSAGYGKVVSVRRKGYVQVGAAAFKLPDKVVYGADLTKTYKAGRVSGMVSGMLPINDRPFLLLEDEIKLPWGMSARGFANLPLPQARFLEGELKKELGCIRGYCASLSAQVDYAVKKRERILKWGIILRR